MFKELFSLKLALCLYKSSIRPYMKYCYHIWAGTPNCYLDMLDKLQKNLCRTVSLSLAAPLKILVHLGPAKVLNVHLNWLSWFYFFILMAGPLVVLKVCMNSQSPFESVLSLSVSPVAFLAQLDSGSLCLQNAFL